MTIAVHISFPDTLDDPLKNFNYQCFTLLSAKYPEHHFIFLFDKPFSPFVASQSNITPVLLSPQIRNRLLGHYWYNFKLPSLLNKYNTDLFVSDRINLSLRTTVKQCMVLQDVSFLEKGNSFSKTDNRYLKRYFKRFVAKANCMLVTTSQQAVNLAKIFPGTNNKTHTVGYGLDIISKKTGQDEMQLIKDKYAGGKEYFICYITDASAANTTTLLKAFSSFKKRQLSNMQLVLALSSSQKENVVKDLSTYKYRNDVKTIAIENDVSLAEISSAAYAAIYLPSIERMETEGLMALKNDVALITTSSEFCKSLYNDAALYTKPEEKSIAEKMMLLYKNENLRNDMVNVGKLVGSIYTWDNTAANLWQALMHTAEQ